MTEKEILRDIISAIKDKADYEYCRGCDITKRVECLGWEAKAKSGEYGKAEYDTHKLANEAFGKHKGLHIAIGIINKALADTEDTGGGLKRLKKALNAKEIKCPNCGYVPWWTPEEIEMGRLRAIELRDCLLPKEQDDEAMEIDRLNIELGNALREIEDLKPKKQDDEA